MNDIYTPPNIANFIYSLRDIGYSLDTAVADIIDNSISAQASNIYIHAMSNEIVIIDDGSGMGKNELREAMRLGSKSPEEERERLDLGRFGLGLKTASFSQCKKLSVFSNPNNFQWFGFRWNLEYISQQNDWLLQPIEFDEYENRDWFECFKNFKTGTVVIWENTDRIPSQNFDILADALSDHLSMVFHRFLEGEAGLKKIKIYFNNRELKPLNPFNKDHPATQELTTEKQHIDNQTVYITPYVLPHYSKVSKSEYDKYATNDGYQKSQGFYLYREGRLLIHGTWFRLHKQCDAHKLVRIKIDINNKLDWLWKIDVKKSTATPAPQIRDCLKRIIAQITERGFRVYKQRGSRERNKKLIPFWNVQHVNEKQKYIINQEHPTFYLLKNILDEDAFSILKNYIKQLEEFLPVESILAKMAQNPHDINQKSEEIEESEIQKIIKLMKESNFGHETIEQLLKAQGFDHKSDLIIKCLEDY